MMSVIVGDRFTKLDGLAESLQQFVVEVWRELLAIRNLEQRP